MKTWWALVARNRLFFRDKGMLFSSLITPVILIVLYATFLAKVYKDSFQSSLPDVMQVSDKLLNGTVAAQLTAALLAVSCVTVTFCVNLTMVQDKASGARKDFDVSPVKRPLLYVGYFCSTVLNSLMVNLLALVLSLIYNGLVFIRMGCCIRDSGHFSFSYVWCRVIQYHLLPPQNTGTDVSSRNHRQCRIWLYLWCIYANI